jgi:hypothetical protein
VSRSAAVGDDLDGWLTLFLEAMGRSTRRRWGPLYVRGLLGLDGPKSEQPIATGLGLAGHDQPEATASVLVNHHARRWTIEPQFRDTKDLRFGMGLSATRIGEPMRRDRLLLVSAFAVALLTLLGTVGQSLGMDRLLKSNTSKTRTHSPFRQGCMLYEPIPNMPEHRLAPLMTAFANAVSQASAFSGILTQAEMRG